METKNVLLVCGSGASSGFMATSMNKASKKRNISIKVIARSTSEVDAYIDSVDAIMIGPHMKHVKDEISELVGERKVSVFVMKKSYYSMLDGDSALDHLLIELDSE